MTSAKVTPKSRVHSRVESHPTSRRCYVRDDYAPLRASRDLHSVSPHDLAWPVAGQPEANPGILRRDRQRSARIIVRRWPRPQTGNRRMRRALVTALRRWIMFAMSRHFDSSEFVRGTPDAVFSYVDDHERLSSHMTRSSWMMGGGRMDVQLDAGRGRRVGSRIRMSGRAFGLQLSLEEVVGEYDPPRHKSWGDSRRASLTHHWPISNGLRCRTTKRRVEPASLH